MPSTYIDLTVHIVFSTKNRQPFLAESIADRTHAYLGGTSRNLGATPLAIGGVADHVHILTGIGSTHKVADLLKETKKTSLWWLRQEMGVKRFGWQEGYAAFSVSHERTANVKKYIARQPEHHKTKTYIEELVQLLDYVQIDHDPSYLL